MDSRGNFMVPFLRVAMASWMCGTALFTALPLRAQTGADLSSRLQQALNADDSSKQLEALMVPEQASALADRFRRFTGRFPETRWAVRGGQLLDDGRQTVEFAVSGTRQQDGLSYSFQAQQTVALALENGLIADQEILSDQSVLTSASKPLPISLLIPDTVLTGSRYDVDVVVDQPLGKSLLAGGLISVTPQQVLEQKSPDIQLEPLGGGGLFKSVQAPFQPGSQVWAALLVHPDGVVTVSKRVQVVDDRSKLKP